MKISKLIQAFIVVSSLSFSAFSVAGTVTITDSEIISAINSKLATDSTVSNLKVHVTSHNGLVTLTGKVNTVAESAKIIELSESVLGVKDVEAPHLIAKKRKKPLNDSVITAKVKGTFVREKLYGEKDIDVTGVNVITTNGVVYLTGSVATTEEAENAVKLARSIHGVKNVDSKLEVKSSS
jgi:hyperosmotically inducible protein